MVEPGLCASCRHAQRIETRASVFWLCRRHVAEPARYPRYPRLPVARCAGHEAGARTETP